MDSKMKKLITGVMAIVLALVCLGDPLPVNAAENKALQLPVKFSGKDWRTDTDLSSNSSTTTEFYGFPLALEEGASYSVSYKLYVPKGVFSKDGSSLSVDVHPNFATEESGWETVGDLYALAWIDLTKKGSKINATYNDNGTTVAVDGVSVKSWGDYYQISINKFPLRGLCDTESWELIPVESVVNGETRVKAQFTGVNTKVTSFILLDDITFYSGSTAVGTQDFSNAALLEDAGYSQNSAKAKDAKTIALSKNILKLSKTSATIQKGKKVTIKATATPSAKITYTSSNKKIATVTSKGVVKGIKKGSTTIKVSVNGVTKTFKVTVK